MVKRSIKGELHGYKRDLQHPGRTFKHQINASKAEYRGRITSYQTRGGFAHSVESNIAHPIHATKERRERKAAREVQMQGRFLRSNRRGGRTEKKPGIIYTAQQHHPVAYESARYAIKYGRKGATIGALASAAGGETMKGDLFRMSTGHHGQRSIAKGGLAGATVGVATGAVVGAVRGKYGKTTKRIRRNEGVSKRRRGAFSTTSTVGYTYNLKGQYKKRGGK